MHGKGPRGLLPLAHKRQPRRRLQHRLSRSRQDEGTRTRPDRAHVLSCRIRGNACKRGVLYVQERSQGVWIWPAWCCYPPWCCCFDHLPWVCRVRDDPDQQVPHALPHEPGPSHYLHDGPAGSQRWSHRLPLAHGHVGVVDAEHGLGRRQRHHVPPLPRPQAPARTLCRRSSLFLLVEERLMGKTWPTYCPYVMGCERGDRRDAIENRTKKTDE